jgi:ribosome-binding protein aMBF1 (putative translation factor)
MRAAGVLRTGLACAALAVLAACDVPAPPHLSHTPQARPAPPPAIQPRSAESQVLSDYYTRVQNDLLAQGLLRRDGADRMRRSRPVS